MGLSKKRITDIYGEQICVGGTWFHAERIFGRPAQEFRLGEVIHELNTSPSSGRLLAPPDAHVRPDLIRRSPDNIMDESKVDRYFEVMMRHQGWGPFPPVSGYVDWINREDLVQCADAGPSIWTSDLGWVRTLTPRDLGQRYTQLVEGHHRCAAAMRLMETGFGILVPVYDLTEEQAPIEREYDRQRPRA